MRIPRIFCARCAYEPQNAQALDNQRPHFEVHGQNKRANDALGFLAIMRGTKNADGLSAFMHNVETDFGLIRIECQIGPILLSTE